MTHCKNAPLEVCSLLFRTKNSTNKREVGDNCPLIYALKQKENLHVSYSSIKGLMPDLNRIIAKYIDNVSNSGDRFDAIVTVPSGHSIVSMLAKRLSKVLNVPVDDQMFRKANGNDIKQELLNDRFGDSQIPRGPRVQIMNAVSKANEENRAFSMSDVHTKNRNYISPLWISNALNRRYYSVLLVDDLFASGKTLIHAKNCLIADNVCTSVKAVCLFSPLNGKIKRPR